MWILAFGTDCAFVKRYLGLAGTQASPEEEIDYLLGSPFEHVNCEKRPESYLATLVLDVCSALEEKELFDSARNEFLAVDICLPMLEVDDTAGQYAMQGEGQHYEPNMPYEEYWLPTDGWKNAPHHRRQSARYYPTRNGGAWDH